jgi:hypothetical protein
MPRERTDILMWYGERSVEALKTLRELRRAARDEIDRLIAFLDESEIDPELEDDEREHDPGESGIADYEGLLEQCPYFYRYTASGSSSTLRAAAIGRSRLSGKTP